MAIKETSQKDIRISNPNPLKEDTGEETLRPKKLTEYIGQTMIKNHLQITLDAAKIR